MASPFDPSGNAAGLNAAFAQAGALGGGAQQQYNPIGNALAQQYALQQGQQAGQYGVKQAQIGQQGPLAAAAATTQGNQLQYQLGQQQLGFKEGAYNQLLSYLNQTPATTGSALGGGGYQGSGAATVAPPPGIPALAPAISGQQLNANINLNNAQNWAQAGGQSRRQTQSLAGSGLGATSPLARALQNQAFGGALQANQQGATQAQMQAAQLNAQQALGGYQAGLEAQAAEYGAGAAAQASQYGSALDYQAALAQVQAQRQNAILNALSNFSS
jgi:hypothetical protein